MKKVKELKKRKIITYYTITIVIPCIILGVLAYRGIKNDQALLERESRRSFQVTSQKLMLNVKDYLNDVEEKFLEITDSIPIPEKIFFSNTSLEYYIDSIPIIEGVFFLNENTELFQLDYHMLYHPEASLEKKDEIMSNYIAQVIERGWQYEFRLKNYKKAILHYQKGLLKASNDYEKVLLFNSIARLQKKNDQKQQALKTYESLYDSYSDIYIEGEIPIGMISLLESGNLYLELSDTIQNINAINNLLREIKNIKWKINYATYSNFIESIAENVESLKNVQGKSLELLQTSDMLLQDIYDYEIKNEYLIDLHAIKSSSDILNSPFDHHHILGNKGDSYFLFLNPGHQIAKWGIVYNQEILLKEIINPMLQQLSSDQDFAWKIVSNNGTVLMSSDKLMADLNPINIVFSKPLPPWTLVILPNKSIGIASFVFNNQSIFFYIFLLIMIILAFGLYFTMFIVNNELRISELKSNFISTVSHEFKSPLTSIRQMAEMLNDGRVPSAQRKQKYYVAILKESKRLSLLINNMLDFSKMEVGQKKYHFEMGNLAYITEEMVLSLSNYWSDKGFKINFILNKSVPDSYFDKESIKQVLQNLVDNACKYSGKSKKIEVRVTSDKTKIYMSVKDYGIGIKKEDQRNIFNRFYRSSDVLIQTVKGSGIGLTIVKQIIKKHQGSIILSSAHGKGSDFQIILPIQKF